MYTGFHLYVKSLSLFRCACISITNSTEGIVWPRWIRGVSMPSTLLTWLLWPSLKWISQVNQCCQCFCDYSWEESFFKPVSPFFPFQSTGIQCGGQTPQQSFKSAPSWTGMWACFGFSQESLLLLWVVQPLNLTTDVLFCLCHSHVTHEYIVEIFECYIKSVGGFEYN